MMRIGKSILSYSPAMLFCRLAGLFQGLVLIRWMEPSELGVWLQLQLITIYGALVHFGVFNAVNRQVPFHQGRDEQAQAKHIENVARGLLTAFLVVSLLGLAGMYFLGFNSTARGRGALTLMFAAIIALGSQFHLGLFRARHEFGRAGAANVFNSLVIVAGLPLIFYWGFDGLLWRAAVAATSTLAVCIALNGWTWAVEFNWKTTKELFRVGFPILVVGVGLVVFSSLDRTLIAWLLDDESMGQYAICFAVAKILTLFPLTIGQIFYPQMTELYASEGITRRLLSRCVQASLLSGAIVGTLAGGAFFLMPTIIARLFPSYVGGLPALQITLFAYFMLALAAGPTYFLISTVQKRRQSAVLVLGIFVMTLCGYLWASHGLIGIAWSLVVGVTVYILGLWTVVLVSSRNTQLAAT